MSQIAVITGAGRGVGRITAITLAKKGWTVVVAGRDKSAIDAVAKEAGGASVGIVCDVSNPDSVKSLFDQVKTTFGRIDLLFNNAGDNELSTIITMMKSEISEASLLLLWPANIRL
jgi:NAD(P)-dependent dehydrogenase (short-subunit alcohol dehydrogenase family)